MAEWWLGPTTLDQCGHIRSSFFWQIMHVYSVQFYACTGIYIKTACTHITDNQTPRVLHLKVLSLIIILYKYSLEIKHKNI